MKLIPIILCGGAGTQLWPVSRELHPKLLICLVDGAKRKIMDVTDKVYSHDIFGKD